jgi:eukaryotic-like serine/threonine-protein kinase
MRYPNEAQYCFLDGADLVPLQDTRVGTTLVGRYQIEEVIGEGGMATVYRAKHKLVERPCAIKIMNPMLATDDVVRERFRREAKNASKLAHPNIIEIFDQGDTDDGTAYIAMELLTGHPLADLIAKSPKGMPVERALPIMVQIARGIARAHDFDVIHRDLKPENIFVVIQKDGSDLAKLLDFGIAKSRTDSRLTGAGELFGTPQYMAPERIERGETGPSVDLYALGVIFWEMLTGKLPFDAPDVATFFVKHLHEKPQSTMKSNPKVPKALDMLVLALLAKDPKMRPVDAHRVHQDLRAIAEDQGILVPPEDDEGPSSERTLQVLPSSRDDPWSRRIKAIEQMLTRVHGGRTPADVTRQLGDVKGIVKRIDTIYETCLGEQKRLGSLDGKAREGRTRFGYAVDALGVDASRARDEVRVARAMASLVAEDVKQVQARYAAAHKEILLWEGRSAFQEPYADLAGAYRAAAAAMDAWINTRDEERKALESVENHQRTLSDLEFQIRELRAALAAHEQSSEGELQASENAILEYNREAEALEEDALARVKRLCEPLGRRPELKQELASLLRDLEGEVAA